MVISSGLLEGGLLMSSRGQLEEKNFGNFDLN